MSDASAAAERDDLPQDGLLPPAPEDLLPANPSLPRPTRDKGLGAVEPVGHPGPDAGDDADDWGASLVTRPDLQTLWRWANVLTKRVNREVNRTTLARQLLNQILDARNLLRRGPDYYEEAERLLNEVAYRLELQRRVHTWARQYGWKLFAYELAWVIALVSAMFLAPAVLLRWAPVLGYNPDPQAGVDSVQWLILGIKSALWGGLGGATGALYALWRHIARDQDFDPLYSIWYYASPLMGTMLGAFAYLAIQAGLFSLTAGVDSRINSAAVVFLLAWMSGFQQNVVYNIVRRILKAVGLDRAGTESVVVPDKPNDPGER